MSERRRFNRREKNAMFLGSDGHCVDCGEHLGDGWHGDHIIPYSLRGKTELSLGQPLCPSCNGRKGARMVWNDQFKPRHFQGEVIKQARARAIAREQVTLALASPGSGKTLAYQAAMTDLIRHLDSIDLLAVYAPRLILAKQAEIDWRTTDPDTGEDNGNFRLFDPRARLERLRHRINASPLLPPGSIREGLASTYQSLVKQPDLHLDWARRNQGRFMLVGDEAQFLGAPFDEGDENSPQAGQYFEQMAQCAGHVLLLTGTEERADGRKLVLCSDFYKQNDKGRWILKPHVRATYRNGIALSYLRQFDAAIPDIKVSWWPNGDERVEYDLSRSGELPPEKRAGLARILRMENIWQALCDLTIQRLRYVQKINARYRALIACMEMSDAKKVKAYLKASYPEMRILIAISEDGPVAEKALRDFRVGSYDVLVTVRKAFIGYDCPEITVVCPLTNYRNIGHLMQLCFRGGRVWKPEESGQPASRQKLHLIVPDDPAMQKFIEYLRREQAEGLKEKAVCGGGGGFQPQGGTIEDAQVTVIRGVTYERDINAADYAASQAVLDEFGPITTPEQIQQLLFSFGVTPGPAPVPGKAKAAAAPRTEREMVQDRKSDAAKIIGRYMREQGHDPADPGYGSERGRITGVVNKAFNIKSTSDITTIRDAVAYLAHVQSYLGVEVESA